MAGTSPTPVAEEDRQSSGADASALAGRVSAILGVAVLLVGVAVLAGWVSDVPVLQRPSPAVVTMKANTAACFALLGLAIWLLQPGRGGRRRRQVANGAALLVVTMGLLTLVEYAFGLDLGIDQVLLSEPTGTPSTAFPGRIAPNTAACFLLAGLAIAALDVRTRRAFRPSQLLIALGGLFSFTALLGYLYGVSGMYQMGSRTAMSPYSATALLVVFLALTLARPEAGLASALSAPGVAGHMVRRLLLPAVALPIGVDLLVAAARRSDLYDDHEASALHAALVTTFIFLLIVLMTRFLHRTDAARRTSEEALRRHQERLEELVAERTAAARAARDQLHGILDNIQDLIATLGPDFRFLAFNAAYAREFKAIFGRQIELGTSLLEALAHLPQERANAEQIWGRALGGEEFRVVQEFGDPSLSRKTFEITYNCLRDSAGRVTGATHVVRDVTERQRAESASARLAAIVESSGDAILSKTLDGTITSWNPAAERMYGYTAQEAVGRKLDLLLTPDRASEGSLLLERIARGEQVEGFDTTRLKKNGDLVPVSLTMSPIRDGNGEVVGVSTIARDISERKHAEETLRESEQRFHEAFESAPAGMVLTSPQGRLLQVNATLCHMLGYSAAELTRRSFADITHPDDLEESREFVAAALRGERTHGRFDKRYLRKDGEPVWTLVRSTLVRDAKGEPRHFLTHVLDISDRKQAEAALRESEARFRGSVESLLDGFGTFTAIRDGSGRITDFRYEYVNDAGCRLNQMTREEQVGRTLLEVLPGHRESGLFDEYVRVVETGRPMVRESLVYEDVYGGGQRLRRAFDVRAVKLGDGFAVTWRDITDRKRTEDEVRRLNTELRARADELGAANRELEAFSYSVSHDLRAPLRALDGFARILQDEHAAHLDAQALRYLGLVRGGARQMGRLIDDLLALSRLGRQPLRKERVETGELVREVLDELRREAAGRTIDARIGDLPPCEADPGLLRQVLVNLLGNAVKFTGARETAVIEVGSRRGDGETSYFVKDNGVGFDMAYADKLFGVFQRLHRARDFEGTGVGLAIVKRIITRHGGRVWGEAAVDRGATFHFTLGGDRDDG